MQEKRREKVGSKNRQENGKRNRGKGKAKPTTTNGKGVGKRGNFRDDENTHLL